MKINKRQLKEMIKEELGAIKEDMGMRRMSELDPREQQMLAQGLAVDMAAVMEAEGLVPIDHESLKSFILSYAAEGR